MKPYLISLLLILAASHYALAFPTENGRRSLMDFSRRADTPTPGCTEGGWQCVENDLQRESR